MPESLSERLAAHVAGLRWEDLPDHAIERAKVFILDTLGVGVAGSTAFGAAELHQAAGLWGDGAHSVVWGRCGRMNAGSAAFLNAFGVHCQEFDCVCEPAVLHPMAALLPAALAYADRAGGVSGRDLLLAVAGGVDVAGWLGIVSTSALTFFRPATAGGFGAAAALGRLMGLDTAGIAHALGLQYSQTSGTMQPHIEASPVLPMQVGFNARAALCAADIAATGLAAPRFSLDGPYGYLQLMERSFDLAPLEEGLGRRFLVAELSHKPYPAGRATHGGIEAAQRLQAEHAFDADDVADVVIAGPPVIARLTGRPDLPSPTPNYARLCMGYVVAKMLIHGTLDLDHYKAAALVDAQTHRLAALVRTEDDGNPDPNALAPQRITITLHDGRVLRWDCEQMLAHPERPLTRDQHLAKFRRCWQFAADGLAASAGEALIERVDRLEDLPDVRALTELIGGTS